MTTDREIKEDREARNAVLGVLEGGIAQNMLFTVGNIAISGENYSTIAKEIRAENIWVFKGKKLKAAKYLYESDTLWTQKFPLGGSLDEDDKALLLHECTHAVADVCMYRVGATSVLDYVDETAAHLAQRAYTLRSMSEQDAVGLVKFIQQGSADDFKKKTYQLLVDKNLHTIRGNGAVIQQSELAPFYGALMQVKSDEGTQLYHYTETSLSGINGLQRSNMGDGISVVRGSQPRVQIAAQDHAWPDPGELSVWLRNNRHRSSDDRFQMLKRILVTMSRVEALPILNAMTSQNSGNPLSREIFSYFPTLSERKHAIKVLDQRVMKN